MLEKDLALLKVLYQEQNITKAAERLYISQPALTYRIKQLEKEFGATIILRGKKGVTFTTQGEYLVKFANKMMLEIRKTKENILNMNNKVEGILRLGVSSNFAHFKLPVILKTFLEKYPNVEVNVKTDWSSRVLDFVQKEEVHIGILRGDINWHQYKYKLKKEGLYIASKKKIKLEDLPTLGRIQYVTDSHLKNTLDVWWQQTFIQPPLITMEVDKIETCREMVMNGLGYGIFPGICLKEDDPLHKIILCDDKGQLIKRNTWLICKDSTLELTVINAFVEFVKTIDI